MVAGDFVSEDVWHRIVHIITNHPELHEYAAAKMIGIVQSKYAPETAVALAGYVLGEFGVNICERVRSPINLSLIFTRLECLVMTNLLLFNSILDVVR